jgi:hypothetical protein
MPSKKLLYAVAFVCFLYAGVGLSKFIEERQSDGDNANPDALTLGFLLLGSLGIFMMSYAHLGEKPRDRNRLKQNESPEKQTSLQLP